MPHPNSPSDASPVQFQDLNLNPEILKTLEEVGYTTPSPIQAQVIPHILEGRDVIGQAKTGTGKTAAFALPLLSRIEIKKGDPQVLVLAPTRELAIQVADAFERYAANIEGFHAACICGGQNYQTQISALHRGPQVVIGTPGRIMDLMRKNKLSLANLDCLVLDEADEMLRMGFIDDVEWILDQSPDDRQITLFSATLPPSIKKIAETYLNNPKRISIQDRTETVDTIRQRFWVASGAQKFDALIRILESEVYNGIIIFVRTKSSTLLLAEKLREHGYTATPLNGDIQQSQREQTIQQFKAGKFNILIATDVAARGLDVEQISWVVNYDMPHDAETYIHRIGRTGRAGRQGDTILFVAHGEMRALSFIERATRQKIEKYQMPTNDEINANRIQRFEDQITAALNSEDPTLEFFNQLLEKYQEKNPTSGVKLAAALAKMLQGNTPFLLSNRKAEKKGDRFNDSEGRDRHRSRRDDDSSGRRENKGRFSKRDSFSSKDRSFENDADMESFRLEEGRSHGITPGQVVRVVADASGLSGRQIGRIEIHNDHTLVDLPKGTSSRLSGLSLSASGGKSKARSESRSRPRFNSDDRSESRSRPRFNSGDRSESRSRPRFNSDDRSESRSRSRPRSEEGRSESKPRSRFPSEEGRSEFKPKSRFKSEEGRSESRSRSRFKSDEGSSTSRSRFKEKGDRPAKWEKSNKSSDDSISSSLKRLKLKKKNKKSG